LLRALNKYDLKKEKRIASFNSYLTISIENQIRMELRKQNNHNKTISLEQPIFYDKEGHEWLFEDVIGTDKDQLFNEVVNKLKKNIVKEALSVLNDREQQIILLKYGFNTDDCKTQKEIAKIFNCSQSGICRQEQRAMIKMRRPKTANKLKDLIN